MTTIAHTKFIQTLKTLTDAELRSFELFLKSPWCNTNKTSIRLLEKISSYYPTFDTPKLEKEKLFKRLLPNGKFSDRRMNNILSDAFLSLEKFLIFQRFNSDEHLQKDLRSQEWQDRQLEDWFFKDTYQEIDRLEALSHRDWKEHLDLFHFQRRIYHYPNKHPQKKRDGQTIVTMGKQLELVYLLEQAAIINEKIFRNRILKSENHEVEIALKKWHLLSEGIEHPALEFYRMRFAYTEERMLEQYFELRDAFLERYGELSLKEQKTHFASLRNDSIKLIRAGHFDITELLPLYKFGLKYGMLLENGILPYMSFSTIVAASNTKKDFSFTQELVDIYSKKLDDNVKNEGKVWAKAHTFYYKENLEDCLNILIQQDFKNKYFSQISKILNTQVYFDLYLLDDSYEDFLFSFFDSFEKWSQREKFQSQTVKKSILRFIQVCRTLAKSINSIEFNEEKVQNLLASESNIQASEWLKRKINTVLDNYKTK